MNLDDRLTRLAQIQKQFAALHAEQFRLIAEIADDPCAGAPAAVLDKQFVTEELRAVLGVSADWVKTTVGTARLLTRTLPATLTALGNGELTVRHAIALCEAVGPLPDADARRVEQACVPFAAGRDYPAFVRKIRRELTRLDSRSVEERFRAALDDRRVWCAPNDTGATQTFGAVLPAAGAQTLLTAVNTAAKDRPTGDPRTMAQRQADGLVRIAQDWLDGLRSAGRHVGPSVQVTISASTLLGLDNQPGELDGHGPIPAEYARAIAADPTGRWRRLITDDAGKLLDYGRSVYHPPKPLADFVRARDRECQFPLCHRPARSCEIDHRQPWSQGGPTNADNLDCLCPRHHHLKDEGGWTTQRLADGTLRWTSPTSRTFDNPPATYPTTTSTAESVGVVPDDTNEADEPVELHDEPITEPTREPPAAPPLGA